MRISTQMIQRHAVNGILDRQNELDKTQQQLSTGRRILTPSDDPSGSTQALALREKLGQIDQYNTNIGRLKSRLEAEESTLDAVGDVLQRLRELGVQGLSNSVDAQGRRGIAAEVRELLGSVFDLANAKDGSGEYLFSGLQSETQPFIDAGAGNYTYQGDQNQRRIQISPTREVQSSDAGSEVFDNLDIAAGGKQSIFKTIYDFAADLEANTPNSDILTDLDTAMSSVFSVRAKIGGRINAVDSQEQVNAQFKVQTQSVLSSVEDLDYAEAIGRMNLQLAGLEAAQKSFQRVQNLSLFSVL
jgi:flagellar hook-associated protein 3 FlgL